MRLVPAPLVSLSLFAMWLALSRSTSLGPIVLGTILALVIPLVTHNARVKVRVRRPLVIVRYILRVGSDVVRSNLAVGWDVVRRRTPRWKFVIIPLDLRDPVGLAALAMVATVVPGTVWSELALDRSAVLVHVWDVGDDEAVYIARFKTRYEQPLREIFE